MAFDKICSVSSIYLTNYSNHLSKFIPRSIIKIKWRRRKLINSLSVWFLLHHNRIKTSRILMWIAMISIDRIIPLSNYTDEKFLWQHHCNEMVLSIGCGKYLRRLWKRKITLVYLSLRFPSNTSLCFYIPS